MKISAVSGRDFDFWHVENCAGFRDGCRFPAHRAGLRRHFGDHLGIHQVARPVHIGVVAHIAAQNLAVPLAALRETVMAMQQVDSADKQAVEREIATLSERFSVFEKALLATRGLMMTTSTEPAQPAKSNESLLTRRQSEILSMVREGASNRAIAGQLGISEGTVKLHVSAILKRLGAKNRTEAAQQSI